MESNFGREPRVAQWLRKARRVLALLSIALLSLSSSFAVAQEARSNVQSRLEMASSDVQLVHAFNWAKQQALAYVFDGDLVGPWYEASLPGRRAFCMRDVSHHAAGAQALGLANHNHNMLRRFAENIAESRDWCSYWEIDALNRPASVDYKSDAVFWYNLPANFDVLDACYRMYLWTGDASYISDPVFLNFYARTVKEYVVRWDLSPDRVMTRNRPVAPPPFFRGDPSYDESRIDIMAGADLLATQYAGYRSYAGIAAARGESDTEALFLRNAADVKFLINTQWWNEKDHSFYALLDGEHHLQGRAATDLLYRGAVDDGAKTEAALETMRRMVKSLREDAVEPASYYAETFYRYGDAKDAYAEMMELSRPGHKRQEYPEVSYSVIGAMVNGLMGINVRPNSSIDEMTKERRFSTVVETLPQLPAGTDWAEMRHVPVRNDAITVRHERNKQTLFTNGGNSGLTWRACFAGERPSVVVNGKTAKAHFENEPSSLPRSCADVNVKPGATAQAHLPE